MSKFNFIILFCIKILIKVLPVYAQTKRIVKTIIVLKSLSIIALTILLFNSGMILERTGIINENKNIIIIANFSFFKNPNILLIILIPHTIFKYNNLKSQIIFTQITKPIILSEYYTTFRLKIPYCYF